MKAYARIEDALYWRYKQKPKTDVRYKWGLLLLVLVFVFLPFFSNAESQCVELFYQTPPEHTGRPYRAYYTDSVQSSESCFDQINGVVVTDSIEFALMKSSADSNDSLSGAINTLNELFGFDPELFAVLTATLLVSFVSGHGTGRVVRYLGKT